MGKEKKQNYSNQNNKTTRNIHKDNTGNTKNKDQFGSKSNNQKDNTRKNSNYNLYHNDVLPPMKPRTNHTLPHSSSNLNTNNPGPQSSSTLTSSKKNQARVEQVQ